MKTLKTIQTLSKIGKILSKIIFILCIIGAAGCLVGIVSLACIPEGIKIGGMTIHGLIEQSAEFSMGTLYTVMATGIIFCAGEAVLCKFAESYFKHELAAGTPFTFEGAKEMIRLGILTVCIPIATAIAGAILYGIMSVAFFDVGDVNFDNSLSIGLGVMFIITGLICRCGAEITSPAQPKSEE